MDVRKKYGEIKQKIIYKLPAKMAHSIIYRQRHSEAINWEEPLTYDEKIHWLIVNAYRDGYGKYADKYEVRNYVKECGLEDILIRLFGVYDNVEQIDYDKLPDKFILKTTHASGPDFYVICGDKKDFNSKAANERLIKALKTDFSKKVCEYHYNGIKPRIICEEFLEMDDQEMLTDYKVVCSCGTPLRVLVCKDRNQGRDYYDTDWNYCDYVKEQYRSGYIEEKPEKLQEMLRAAAVLSKSFPLARIDFYVVKGKLYFGEITLSPAAGNHEYLNQKGQDELGKLICLNRLKNDSNDNI